MVSVCLPGPNEIAELAEVDELHDLRLADDELRAALDFLVLVRKAVRERVARVVGPLDDLDELAADEVGEGHQHLILPQPGGPTNVGPSNLGEFRQLAEVES